MKILCGSLAAVAALAFSKLDSVGTNLGLTFDSPVFVAEARSQKLSTEEALKHLVVQTAGERINQAKAATPDEALSELITQAATEEPRIRLDLGPVPSTLLRKAKPQTRAFRKKALKLALVAIATLALASAVFMSRMRKLSLAGAYPADLLEKITEGKRRGRLGALKDGVLAKLALLKNPRVAVVVVLSLLVILAGTYALFGSGLITAPWSGNPVGANGQPGGDAGGKVPLNAQDGSSKTADKGQDPLSEPGADPSLSDSVRSFYKRLFGWSSEGSEEVKESTEPPKSKLDGWVFNPILDFD